MGAIQGRGMEYGKAHREHAAITQELSEARERVHELEEAHRKSQMAVTQAQRVLLEEAQKA